MNTGLEGKKEREREEEEGQQGSKNDGTETEYVEERKMEIETDGVTEEVRDEKWMILNKEGGPLSRGGRRRAGGVGEINE